MGASGSAGERSGIRTGGTSVDFCVPPDWTGVQVDNSMALVLGLGYTIAAICIFSLQVGALLVGGAATGLRGSAAGMLYSPALTLLARCHRNALQNGYINLFQ